MLLAEKQHISRIALPLPFHCPTITLYHQTVFCPSSYPLLTLGSFFHAVFACFSTGFSCRFSDLRLFWFDTSELQKSRLRKITVGLYFDYTTIILRPFFGPTSTLAEWAPNQLRMNFGRRWWQQAGSRFGNRESAPAMRARGYDVGFQAFPSEHVAWM